MRTVSFDAVMDTVEETMRKAARGDFDMPQRLHMNYGENTYLLMPCFSQEAFGTKLVTVFPENQEKNMPVIDGIMILNDSETGRPVAMMDARVLTGLRTGAVGGVSARHMVSEDAEKIGLIGAGVQGFYQMIFVSLATDINDFIIFDLQEEKIESLIGDLQTIFPDTNMTFKKAADARQVVKEADLVVTATTSKNPVMPNDINVFECCKHFIGVGSFEPDMREFPENLFLGADMVVVDTEHALKETGDIIVPLKNGWIDGEAIKSMGDLLDNVEIDDLSEKNTVFKSVGMAAFDLMTAQLIYDKADQEDVGQIVDL